jgi:hypothetical protein
MVILTIYINQAKAPLANPFGWPPLHRIGAIHWIGAVKGRVQTEHHGDDVYGGSSVDARRRISRTISTIGNLWGGSFLFPPEPL